MTKSRTWLISGASRGLGRALAEAALNAGDRVVATVRGEHALPNREGLVVHRWDVRDRDGAHDAVATAVAAFGGLDVLVNNAGYGLVGAIEEVDEAAARQIIDTDLFGALWLSQAALPIMRAQRSGHIVQVSTVGAVGTMPTMGLYNAAKWGLEGFSEALAAEVRQFGIRVTIAELGGIDTEWATASMRFAPADPAYDELRTELFGTPEVPWPQTTGTGGGMPPDDAAAAILRHVDEPADVLRTLIGDDAPAQVAAALAARVRDYEHDPRFSSTSGDSVRTTRGDLPRATSTSDESE